MPRVRAFLPAMLALALAFAPALAEARAGSGGSFGSRGAYTYVAPPTTNTAPFSAAPMERSLTPRPAPSPSYPGYGYGYGSRSPFMSGLLGGLLGAGIGGLLFGHGLFGGISGIGSLFGLLIQIFLIVLLVRWLFRAFAGRQPAFAGGLFPRSDGPMPGRPLLGGSGGAPQGRPVQIEPQDYQQFEQALYAVQAAWSAHDIGRLRGLATPEMVGYFGEQLAEQASRGVRNIVSDVRLQQGDLAEAWAEGGREYATVAMRFAMTDATVDGAGRVVDGSTTEHVAATEIWTFVRAPGGRWIVSAIQQAR